MSGEYSKKQQNPPEIQLTARAQEVLRAKTVLLNLARGLHPGVVSMAYSYQDAGPELAYLLRSDGLTMEVTERDGPIRSARSSGEVHADPSALFNEVLAQFPDPDEAVLSGFATTDDGSVYMVARL